MIILKIDSRNLEIAMAKKCFSAEQLSKLTGISTITITRIKNGIQEARPATVGKLAIALDAQVEELIESEAATSNQLKRKQGFAVENHQNEKRN